MKEQKCIILFLILLLTPFLLFSGIDEEIDEGVERYISGLKSSSETNLIKIVVDGKKGMKVAAVRRLGNFKSKRSKELLVAVMTYVWDPDNFEKKYLKGNKKALPVLDEDVRGEAALSLGKIRDPKYISIIGNTALVDPGSKVRLLCLKALGVMRNKEGVVYIEKVIKFELTLNKNKLNNDIIKAAVQAIGNIGHKNGFFILIEVTQTKKLKHEVRKEALKALEKLKWE